MAETFESSVTSDNQTEFYDGNYYAQTFLAESTHTITAIDICLLKQGTPAEGDITVEIQTTSGGEPTGSALASGTMSSTDLAVGATVHTIDMDGDPITVQEGTLYAIVVKPPATIWDSTNNAYIRYDSGNPYADGIRWFTNDSGSTWNTSASDLHFTVYGSVFITNKTYSKALIAISNDEVWYESSSGTMEELTDANGDIATSDPLTAAEAFQKGFIANVTNLKVIDKVNSKITTGALSTHPPDFGNVLTGGSSNAVMIVDHIDALTGAAVIHGYNTSAFTFISGETVTGTDDDGNTITFATDSAEDLAPHWYDWTVFGGDATNNGAMPSEAKLVCRYRGRLVLAGHASYPHQWWMSRVANPWDFLYNANDPLSAISGQDADAGEIGDIITALIPYGDDYLLIGGSHSIHLVTGDPAAGGRIDEISSDVGIYSQHSWCKDSNGNLYFFGNNGIYKMEGGRSKPQNLSIGVLPKLIEDWAVDNSTDRIVLTYDPKRDGILISKVDNSDGSNEGYWFSLKTMGFYPEAYPEECSIWSSVYYDSMDSSYRKTVYGGYDGYLRYFDDTAKSDDAGAANEAISSYVALPSMPLNDGMDKEGKIDQIIVTAAGGAASGDYSDSDLINYAVHTADDSETLIEDILDGATASLSGTISGTGRKARIRQRVRGMYGTMVLSNATISSGWAVNSVLYNTQIGGKL